MRERDLPESTPHQANIEVPQAQGGPISQAREAGADFVYLTAEPEHMMVLWLDPIRGVRAVAKHDTEWRERAENPEPWPPPVDESSQSVYGQHEAATAGAEVKVVDVAKLEAEKREQQRARKREYVRDYIRRRYHETKQAARAGDEEAQQRWQRMQELNREGQCRWRMKHPEKHRAKQRNHYQRKRLRSPDAPDSTTDQGHDSD
jgi:hypothetical protein